MTPHLVLRDNGYWIAITCTLCNHTLHGEVVAFPGQPTNFSSREEIKFRRTHEHSSPSICFAIQETAK